MYVLEDPVIADIAKQKDRSNAQIILSWVIERGLVVVTKST